MLEKKIEEHGGKVAKECGVLHLKFTSPNRAAVPDRLVLRSIPPIVRPLIARYVKFVEYKAEGKKPTPAQEREHARLRNLGFVVEVVDNKADAEAVIRGMGDETPHS